MTDIANLTESTYRRRSWKGLRDVWDDLVILTMFMTGGDYSIRHPDVPDQSWGARR